MTKDVAAVTFLLLAANELGRKGPNSVELETEVGTTSTLSIACPIRQEQGECLSLNAWVVVIQLKAMGL